MTTNSVNKPFPYTELQRRLAGTRFGGTVHFLETTDSTNTVALELAEGGAPEGDLVIADRQKQGRGRLPGRNWQSPAGRNLYVSAILRPMTNPSKAATLTLTAGVAVAEALEAWCPGRVSIKWPNDVNIGGKKVSGILTEMRTRGDSVDFVVVGIGVNIFMKFDEFDEQFRHRATSLLEETTHTLDRVDVAAAVLRSLDRWYETYSREGFAPVRSRWLDRAGTVNERVTVDDRGSSKKGIVRGIDEEGALLLEDEAGSVVRILSGDVLVQ
ncbi:MAG TPA: biotin--[acetyl-CoA-carboxylase] ligase [Deltaproteobacteria bacterium]|nr:biotin--[acetyl-CoA-carboxylase] ligase [Deltaproteobacteria bacterium]